MTTNSLMQTLLAMSGQSNVITIHRVMVKYTGSYEIAAMLSQLLYWTPRSKNDGWIAKSDKEWMDELYISRRAVRSATEKLKNMGLIDIQLKKFNGAPTNHYKINLDVLDKSWRAWLEIGLSQNDTIHCPNWDNGLSQTEQSLTEITTENTTVNIPKTKIFSKEKYMQETKRIVEESFIQPLDENSDRISQYPEDVRVIISAVCKLFNLKCPTIKSTHAGHWITESRELRDACGEFEKAPLVEISEEFKRHMDEHHGTVPFTISSPASLVKSARAKAAVMRTRNARQTDMFIPKGARLVYAGGKVYAPGIGEVDL